MKDNSNDEIAKMELAINLKDISYSRLMDLGDFMRSDGFIRYALSLDVNEEIDFRHHGLKIEGCVTRVK